jgi:predicted permease
MDTLHQDLRLAFRRLRSAPGFSLAAIATLAIGIGANAAIFSVVYAVVLRPLPFAQPSDLYMVFTMNRTAGQQAGVSAVDLDDWRAQKQSLADIGGYFYADGATGMDLQNRGEPRRLRAVFVSPGFFSALGVAPAQGRLPREDELVRGGPDKVVVLSHAFWMREFGGAVSAVREFVTLNGQPFQVLGVLPPDMRFPTTLADVYVPFSIIPDSGIPRVRQVRILSAVARAIPGTSIDRVQAEMNAIAARLAGQYPENRQWDTTTVMPLAEVVSGAVRGSLFVLMGAVGFVLLIACVNLAGLQLARGVSRAREMGIRVALGARRSRLIRQMLTESFVLAGLGGSVGLLLAYGGVAGVLALGAHDLPRANEIDMNGIVLAFAAAATVSSGCLFGAIPALRVSLASIWQAAGLSGRSIAGVESHRLRSGLVVAEVALAVMLVAAAGLMTRSFVALVRVDAGFRPDHLVAVMFTIDVERQQARRGITNDVPGTEPSYATFYREVIDRVRALPGVVSAAAVKDAPFRGNGERIGFRLEGRPVGANEAAPSAVGIHVSDGYFRTIGARVIEGREFTRDDRVDTPRVVVVNEAFMRRYYPGESSAGKALVVGQSTRIPIVGVVNDIRQVAMNEPAEPTVYIANLQNSRVKTTIVARTAGEPLALVRSIREAVWSIDPLQPITEVFTFEQAVGVALTRPRLLTVLLAGFGATGLLLGIVGIYGMLAFALQERRREIGVRLALGARPVDIRTMFLRSGLAVTSIGLGIGLAGAAVAAKAFASVLYGVPANDPATLAGVVIMLMMAAAAASWLPAARAARVDPAETLRTE